MTQASPTFVEPDYVERGWRDSPYATHPDCDPFWWLKTPPLTVYLQPEEE